MVSAILLSAFAFLVAYLGIFYLVDLGYVLLTYRQYQSSPMDLFKNGFYTFLFTYFLFNGIMLLGSVYFSKHSFIKTILALIVGLVLLYHLNNFLMEVLTGIASVTSSAPLGGFQFEHLGENVYVTLPENSGIISDLFVRVLLPLAFWGITWLRFKEKEI